MQEMSAWQKMILLVFCGCFIYTHAQNPLPADLKLAVSMPKEGDVLFSPVITVRGTVVPGATVMVSGNTAMVLADGSFAYELYIPYEKNMYVIEIVASFQNKLQKIARTIEFRPDAEKLKLIIEQPAESSFVCEPKLLVSGSVRPVEAVVTINSNIAALRNGSFMEWVSLPLGKSGILPVVLVAISGTDSITTSRNVLFEPARSIKCNVDAPSLSPTELAPTYSQKKVLFTVMDKTPGDELTFFTVIDNNRESETGVSGGSFALNLKAGTHSYRVYAEDFVHNRSTVLNQTIQFVPRGMQIQMISPTGNASASLSNESTYEVSFKINGLPDDDAHLLREVKVLNQKNGKSYSEKNCKDVEFSFDVDLVAGSNKIMIEVRDVNNAIILHSIVIDARQ
jgi:hypothetical protein